MKNTLETRLGLFVALAVLAAAILLERVGTYDSFRQGKHINALFNNIQDLKVGDHVKMGGVEIGRVQDIVLTNNRVLVVMKVRPEAEVKTDSTATVKFTGLMGQNFVSIDFGAPQADSPKFSVADLTDALSLAAKLQAPANKVSSYIRGRLKESTRQELAQWEKPKKVPPALQQSLIEDLNAVIEGTSIWSEDLFENRQIRQETRELLERNPRGKDPAPWLNRLLLEDSYSLELSRLPERLNDNQYVTTAEQADLSAMMQKIDNVATGVENLTKSFTGVNIDTLIGPLRDLIQTNSQSLTATISNSRRITDDLASQISQGKGTLGKLIKDEALYNTALSTVSNLQDTASEIRATVADARKIVNEINAGQGTVGKLVKDEALYRETTESMTNLKEILQKVNHGQGTVGKLINDQEFYRNAKLTLQKLDMATETLEDQGPLTILGIAVGKLF